jgi:UPF0716 protein FxsA
MIVLLLLIVWPLAELFVIVEVAESIGILLTLLLLIAGWPLGSWAIRSQGRAVLGRMAAAVGEGRVPTREVLDGALVLIGGLLLMLPGFISDVFGILLLVPLTRMPLRKLLARNFRSPMVTQTIRFTTRGRTYDVDSTASDIDHPPTASDPDRPRLGR